MVGTPGYRRRFGAALATVAALTVPVIAAGCGAAADETRTAFTIPSGITLPSAVTEKAPNCAKQLSMATPEDIQACLRQLAEVMKNDIGAGMDDLESWLSEQMPDLLDTTTTAPAP